MIDSRFLALRYLCPFASSLAIFLGTAFAIQPDENVFYPIPQNLTPDEQPVPTDDLMAHDGYADADSDDVMTINAYIYKPNGVEDDEELPTVILLHGSSSLWSNRDMDNGISFQYRDWAEELTDRGYLVIMPDSYHLRGISDGFSNRRPSTDSDEDDALCSPNYERPKDVVATLQYLATRDDVDVDNIGVIAFSQGAQTALNSVLDPTIDLSPYEENCEGQQDARPAPDPVRIPNNLPFPKVMAIYYPGCGFFDYHGSPNDTGADRFMPDTRTKVLMFHGSADSLMDDEFPVKCVAASRAHASVNGYDDPFIYHYVFEGADHSFDGYSVDIEPEANWWTDEESADEAAKRISRKETLRQFGYRLKGEPYLIVPKFTGGGGGNVKAPNVGNNGLGSGDPVIKWKRKQPVLIWRGEDGLGYQLVWTSGGRDREVISPEFLDQGQRFEFPVDREFLLQGRLFLEATPGLEAWEDWRNLGLIRYEDPSSRLIGSR